MNLVAKQREVDVQKWQGAKRPYDLVKEATIAFTVVAVLALSLGALFGSPDEPALTTHSWATDAPADFVVTATGELAGTTTSATYGPPYNTASEGQSVGPLSPAKWIGVHIPVDPANDFVINPLKQLHNPDVDAALATWSAAAADQQLAWANAYADALAANEGATSVEDPSGRFGPVPTLITGLLGMASTGALDGALTTEDSVLSTNFTKPMMFLGDGEGYFAEAAAAQHLEGDQWGMMNETGSFPGQSWLWLMSFWYQVEPFKSSETADLQIFLLMGLLSIGFMFIPFIPGVRRLPYLLPIHRLIWRSYYSRKQ